MKIHMRTSCLLLAVLAAILLPVSTHAAKVKNSQEVPDFTKGGKQGDSDDWTLGPTGARGWIYTAGGNSSEARQILITAVAKGSPSDGALSKGDVILGVDGKVFAGDARVQFAAAISAAESEKGGGKLRLLRWREGKTDVVELKLQVLGSYSATAPYDCPKSKRILDQGCAALAHRMGEANYTRNLNAIPRSLNALALLASGNRSYLPLVKREAEWAAGFSAEGFATWYYGYVMTLLGEYVIATGDQSVMPGLKRLALESAHGQSRVGTWGHAFAMPSGNLNGYGCMNQPGISLTIGMVLAREAGVHEPDVDRAIAKAAAFVRWFANKGAVPYGDHLPFPAHEDNGKCSSAAVLYDLLGDREAAEFFGKMSTAAYSERERGHTGNYFNMLWALPGVARCGPLATGAYLREQSWYYDLARGWDTGWLYQASPVGAEEHHKYTNWDCSGGYLLAYALPLKSLRLTEKKPFCVPPLTAAQVAEVIAAGRDFDFSSAEHNYDKRTTQQLLAGLTNWSPFVRKRSAAALGNREGDFVSTLLKVLASNSRDARYGACEALGALGPRADAAAAQLRALLKDPDPWMQSLAAEAIPNLSPAARKASVSDLLAMTVRTNPADPRHMAARAASIALFSPYPGHREPKSILAESLEGVDRAVLYPAVKSLLQNDDSVVRGSVRKTFDHLTDSDLVTLLPDITRAIQPLAPSNEMFADGIRLGGLDLLSRLHIREGMALCVSVMEPDRWGEKNRAKDCLTYLQRYGTHAKPLLPKLQEMRTYLVKVKKVSADHLAEFDRLVAAIGTSTDTPALVSLSEFKSRSSIR
jgi:HEAT repeat protein